MSGRLKAHPGVELYLVDCPNIEDQIDTALLNDLHCPVKLAFVGGELAKRLAKAYSGTWIEDTPSVNDDLLAFWEVRRS
jgi:hypothetical protein